jgi:hypothetical protein
MERAIRFEVDLSGSYGHSPSRPQRARKHFGDRSLDVILGGVERFDRGRFVDRDPGNDLDNPRWCLFFRSPVDCLSWTRNERDNTGSEHGVQQATSIKFSHAEKLHLLGRYRGSKQISDVSTHAINSVGTFRR